MEPSRKPRIVTRERKLLTQTDLATIMINIQTNKQVKNGPVCRRWAMPRTVSASEAKTQFAALVEWTVERQDEVIVASHGKPKAVILSFAEYQKLAELREEARRRGALARLEQLREEVSARNQDLTEEQAEELADKLVRDTVARMIREGKIKYEGS
jgi:prevent-host-death family protein